MRHPPLTCSCASGGGQINCLITDPPYGVDYTVTGRGVKKRPIANDNKKGKDLQDFLLSAFSSAYPTMLPGAVYYVFGPSGSNQEEFYAALRKANLPVHQALVWVKTQLVLGRSDYQNKHEMCFYGSKNDDQDYDQETDNDFDVIGYGWKPGAKHSWNNDRKQTTVLEFDKPAKSAQHPTMKPIKLLSYLIKNNTDPGEQILDVFGGSGSTLIACEQTDRRCFVIELDPHYCDVIIERWETLTGKKAVLIDG